MLRGKFLFTVLSKQIQYTVLPSSKIYFYIKEGPGFAKLFLRIGLFQLYFCGTYGKLAKALPCVPLVQTLYPLQGRQLFSEKVVDLEFSKSIFRQSNPAFVLLFCSLFKLFCPLFYKVVMIHFGIFPHL